jgi:exodeoxyribonuclease-3
MRIATWNINGVRARFELLARWLKDRAPDVVGLQEIKVDDGQFPSAELAALGYHAVVFGQPAWNGVAVLSRAPAEILQKGLPGQEDFGARLVTVQAGNLAFCTVYCPNGKDVTHPDFPRKLAWLGALHAHLDSSHTPDQNLVVCGDFNVCPAPIDSWNEKDLAGQIFHTDDERGRFRRLLDWGLVDLFRQAHPDEQQFSWWDYRGGAFHRRQGLRIDFLLGTRGVAERVQSVEIDREYRKKLDGLTPSDHAPVLADLAPPASP